MEPARIAEEDYCPVVSCDIRSVRTVGVTGL